MPCTQFRFNVSLSHSKQVWKDVDGVLTCDPKICPNAMSVPYLTFDEAAELAYFGAQVCFFTRIYIDIFGVVNKFY